MRPFLAPPPDAPVEAGPRPTFSVVIPAYQAAATVLAAVQSVLAQTEPAWEIIVADDGSSDDLELVLAQVRDRITLLRLPHRGVSATRNAATAVASGEFVANLDADDLFAPTRLEALADLVAARPDLDVVATDCWIEAPGHGRWRLAERDPFAPDDQRAAILTSCLVSSPAVRRSRLLESGGYDESMKGIEDWDMWLRLVYSGSKIGFVDEPLYIYTQSPTSITADRPLAFSARARLMERVLARGDLSTRERQLATATLRISRRRLFEADARAAIDRSGLRRRRALFALGLRSGVPFAGRVKAFAAAAAPGLAARFVRRSRGVD